MKLWGHIAFNGQRNHWYVRGRWQGRLEYFSQIPTDGGGWLTCRVEEMAQFLQRMISKEIEKGRFNPTRFKKSRPHQLKKWAPFWLSMQGHIEYGTLKGYRSYIDNWIIPLIGDFNLGDIGHAELVQFFNDLPLNIKTKKNIFGVLHAMMDDSRKAGFINQLPDWIKFKGARSIPQREIQWISKSTQELILAEIPERHRPIFQFIMLTGVRPSEARALRKKDIKSDHILIAVTFAPKEGGGEALKVVKNRKEEAIPLYDAVRELLAGIPGNLTEFVFINSDTGKPYTFHFNQNIWNPACKRALGYVVRLNNAGRHSFANQLLAAGEDLENVSALLRHSSTGITKKNYGRPHLQVLKRKVDNVQRLK